MKYIWIIVYSIIAIFGYNCSDYNSYKYVYEVLVPEGLSLSAVPDIGYDILCRISSFLGLSFEVFRGLYIFAALILFYKGVCYFCDKPNRVFFLYFLYPFFLDVAQFRFFMAYAIAIYALRYIVVKKNWKYILLICVAATQHFSVILFLLFLMLNMNYRNIGTTISIVATVESIAFFFAPNLISLLLGNPVGRAGIYIQRDTYSLYLFVAHMGMALISVCLSNYLVQHFLSDKNIILSKILLIAVAFVPFIIIDPDYMRLYRTITPLIYIGMYIPSEKKGVVPITNLYALIYCLFMFYIFISPHNTSHWNDIVKALINNNYFFELFR